MSKLFKRADFANRPKSHQPIVHAILYGNLAIWKYLLSKSNIIITDFLFSPRQDAPRLNPYANKSLQIRFYSTIQMRLIRYMQCYTNAWEFYQNESIQMRKQHSQGWVIKTEYRQVVVSFPHISFPRVYHINMHINWL